VESMWKYVESFLDVIDPDNKSHFIWPPKACATSDIPAFEKI